MKMEETKSIPVVFAADDTYAPYLGVAIYSLIANTSKEYRYKIYILTRDLSEEHTQRILSMRRENVELEIVNITELMANVAYHKINHLSQATSFRLILEKLRTKCVCKDLEGYTKVLYLDTDMIIHHDVAELYQESVDGYVLAAVRGQMFVNIQKNVEENLKLRAGIRDYFNAGVLLINLPLFCDNDIGNKGLAMLSEKSYPCQDQDVLNILCQGKVKFLDWHWNVEWQHIVLKNVIPIVIDEVRKDSLEAVDNPYIIHYTGHIKPWERRGIGYPLAEYFWHYARQTVFYEEILARNLLQQPPAAGEVPSKTEPVLPDPVSFALPRDWDRFVFPWHLIAPGSRVVIRGGGVVGQVFVQQLQATQYAQVEAVCDRQAVPGLPVPCIRPQELSAVDCDAVVIALEKPSIAAEIRQELLQLGIPAGKIKYANPARMR